MEVRIQLMEAQEFREWADRTWVAARSSGSKFPCHAERRGQLKRCTQVIGPSENSRQGSLQVVWISLEISTVVKNQVRLVG